MCIMTLNISFAQTQPFKVYRHVIFSAIWPLSFLKLGQFTRSDLVIFFWSIQQPTMIWLFIKCNLLYRLKLSAQKFRLKSAKILQPKPSQPQKRSQRPQQLKQTRKLKTLKTPKVTGPSGRWSSTKMAMSITWLSLIRFGKQPRRWPEISSWRYFNSIRVRSAWCKRICFVLH